MAAARRTRLLLDALAVAGALTVGGALSVIGAITGASFNGQIIESGTITGQPGQNPASVTYIRVGGIYFLQGATAPVVLDVPKGSIYMQNTVDPHYFYKYGDVNTNWGKLFQQNGNGYNVGGLTINSSGPFLNGTGMGRTNPLQATALAGDVTDWDPAGSLGANLWQRMDIFVTSDAARSIRGMYRPPQTYKLSLRVWNMNTDAARTITLTHEDAGEATATRRFYGRSAANVVIPIGGFAEIYSDNLVRDRWLAA